MLESILAIILIGQFGQDSSIPWAFKKPVRPEIPPGAHPVDALVGTPENAKVLSPAAFLRRLSFDTRGLPPPPSALDDFLSWSDQERVSKIVDYLIDTPAFGEKQGQAWLDAVRFAETNGFETDGDRPHAWRYRDWVIAAFNREQASAGRRRMSSSQRIATASAAAAAGAAVVNASAPFARRPLSARP